MKRDISYVLVLDGIAKYTSTRMERLNEAMAGYSAAAQALMHIDVAEELE